MLRETLLSGIKNAMKTKNAVELDALRFVWARVKELEIDKKTELTDEEIVSVISREVKARREAILQFSNAHRNDLVDAEEEKLTVLVNLLPKQMTESEIEEVVEQVRLQVGNNFGQVMSRVMELVKGRADGSLVSNIVKQKLS